MCNIFVSTYWYMYDIFNSAEWYMSCICHFVVFHIKSPRQTSPRDIFKSPRDNSLCGFIGGQMGVNFFKSLHRFTVVYT